MRFAALSFLVMLSLVFVSPAKAGECPNAEISVRYGGKLKIFDEEWECPALKASSFVNDIYYQSEKEFIVVRLRNTYYAYCAVTAVDLYKWTSAPSLGRHYNQNFRNGLFDCRDHGLPDGIYLGQ